MRFAQAQQGLNNASTFLAQATQVNNIQVIGREKTISWIGRKPGIIKGSYYPLEYQYLLDTHQYSILLSDGSFFQFYYQFDEEEVLKSARLAFYPKPLSTKDNIDQLIDAADGALEKDDQELYEHLYNWTELMEIKDITPSNTSHIRFDYDHSATSHSPSHLQLGGIHEFRVSANYFPQPLAFVQLCEMSYSGARSLLTKDLAFEKQHHLSVQMPDDLITLQWPT